MKEFIEENKNLISQIAHNYNVNANIHPEDHIFQFLVTNPVFPSKKEAIDYYFNDGQNSAQILLDLITSFYPPTDNPIKLLEFASGYGCVTRHLLNLQANLNITACDIHEKAITFIENTLNHSSILSHPEPEHLKLAASTYDIVFCLSFFSHMPDTTWFRWLQTLYSAVSPGGLFIFTTHGYQSKKYFGFPNLNEQGYWFLSSSEQFDLDVNQYGQMIVSPSYVCSKIKLLPYNPIIKRFTEGFWWEHQDLWVIKKEEK
ncbi:class I SAM-dependent methyltransferase [Bacillus cereus]|uniref:Class I SAM-dependent methyltransferase n=1 Tax=Bacillus luti TaxID=2026191 RepID=A0ABU8I1F5_9BACI|nr:class I SAM-dependent methyltransferase [Bacillus luti]RGN71758.1 class I SAM-dependent methyltransferase [Bacillus cereus]